IKVLNQLVEVGRLGRKTGAGFRQFVGPKAKPAADPAFEPILEECRLAQREIPEEEIRDRLFLAMLLEAIRLLEEEVVVSPAHVDMGMILGTGFPTFRGGLLRWCDTEGAGNIIKRSEKLMPLGQRFEVPDSLHQMAKTGEKYYPIPDDVVESLREK
ncbi:MAG: 3-hydroxyacyl-CoA dehydrogenase, partial [Planctomycetaceae bacterium]|nr:3-hydroxyacyl-CoA dehydrogenase [Planctomycetaceae bacterium]